MEHLKQLAIYKGVYDGRNKQLLLLKSLAKEGMWKSEIEAAARRRAGSMVLLQPTDDEMESVTAEVESVSG